MILASDVSLKILLTPLVYETTVERVRYSKKLAERYTVSLKVA